MNRPLRWSHAAAVAGLVLVVHGSAGDGGFHYDDRHSVADNPHVRNLGNLPRFFVDPAAFSVDEERGMYRPVLLTSYALGHAVHGGSARGYQLTNLALHALSAVLVAWIASILTSRLTSALVAGVVFGLHPASTEPIHYVSARSDGLVTCFILLSVALWLWADGRRTDSSRWRRPASWLTAAAALWTKATAVCLPVVLLLLDLLRGRRQPAWLVRRHAPVWGLTVLYLLAIWWTDFLPRSLAAPSRELGTQLLTQTKALAYYAHLMVWPLGLSVEPAFAPSVRLSASVGAAVLLVVAASIVVVAMWRRGVWRPLFLATWAGIALMPTALMPLNVLVNERRVYLPLAAFAIAVALAVARLPSVRAPARRGFAAAFVVVLGILSHQRGEVWASELSLWQDAALRGPAMPRARLYLGDAHLAEGRGTRDPELGQRHFAQARSAYEAVVSLDPDQRMLLLQAQNGLAVLDTEGGELAAAEHRLAQILVEHPTYADGLVNLGNIFYQRAALSRGVDTASLQRAIELYERALARSPGRYEARLNLGAAYHLAGDLVLAQAAYENVAELAPGHGVVAVNLGNLYLQRGRAAVPKERGVWLGRAGIQFERALEILPDSEGALRGLEAVQEALAASGRRP